MIELTEEEIADTKQRIEAIRRANLAEKIEEMDIHWEKCIILSDLIIENQFDTMLNGEIAGWGMIRATIQHYVNDTSLGAYYAQIYPDKYKHLMDNYNKIEKRQKELYDAYYEMRRKKYEEERNLPWWKRIF